MGSIQKLVQILHKKEEVDTVIFDGEGKQGNLYYFGNLMATHYLSLFSKCQIIKVEA